MAAVLDTKTDPTAQFGSQVDEQIAQATSRIRVHDLTLGGLSLAAMLAVYATLMIALDKYLALPEWMRQLSLVAFLAGFGAVAYFLVVRPLRQRINPLYAAARVEETIEDAKNSVTGYVEAQESGRVTGSVKAAMSAKAARAVGEADVNRAVNHRSLLVAGGVLVVAILALTVLFFLFRGTQFTSLVGRAFAPFTADPIASRTQLSLVKPEPGDPTITTGQTINVGVRIGGRIPKKTGTERLRVLLRHNPADPNYEELAMEEGETSRDFQLKVPEHLVQNGFWYKVAGGDAETPEFKVTVRSLPLFTDFEANYEYPAYTRKPAARSNDANLRAYRGTKITLIARTNREVQDGSMKFEAAGLPPVAGKPVAGKPDSLVFSFTATEATRYRLSLTSVQGEKNSDPPPYNLILDSDQPPRVEITKPEEPETVVPANGALEVNGTVGDDFGIDKVRLRLRVDNRELAAIPDMGADSAKQPAGVVPKFGKSFRRETDNTWPNDYKYKGSADFTKLTDAVTGAKFDAKEGMVVEFWLEAIDNCTEAKPVEGWGEKPQAGNVGKSDIKKVKLSAPKVEPEATKQLDQKRDQRRNEEQQHNQQQQQQLKDEKRDPPKPQEGQPQPPKKDEKPDPKQGEGEPKQGGSKQGEPKQGEPKQGDPKQGDPKQGDNQPPKKGGAGTGGQDDSKMPPGKDDMPPPKKEDGKGGTDPGATDPKGTPPDPKGTETKKDDGPKGGMGMPDMGMGGTGEKPPMETAPPPKTNDEKKAEADAKQVQDELDRNKGTGGDAKPNPSANTQKDRTDPGAPKPQPKDMNPADAQPQTKEGPKPADPMAKDGDKNAASETRPEGKLQQPPPPQETKPKPDEKAKPSENRDGPSELGGNTGGKDKESPEPKKDGKNDVKGDNTPPPKDPKNENKDPNSGSSAKPAAPPQEKDMGGDPKGPETPKNPGENAGTAKPNNAPSRGEDKTPGQPKPGPNDEKPKDDDNAGNAKPDKAPSAGQAKPAPKEDAKGGKAPDATESKAPPKPPMDPGGGDSPAESKPENAKPMGGMGMGDKNMDHGTDKPTDKAPPPAGGGNADPKDKKDPKDNTGGGAGPKVEPKDPKNKGDDKGKIDEKQLKELQDAARDLDNPDPNKRKEAQDKLDKTIGEKGRKEIEQMAKDLKSDDKSTRDAAEKKVEEMKNDLKKRAEEQAKKDGKETGKGKDDGKEEVGKPKELTPEEIAELVKNAGDLNSDDKAKREAAEKALDDKLGKEAREQLQEAMKNPPKDKGMNDPKEQEALKKKIEELAKKNPPKGTGGKGEIPKEWTPGGGQNTESPKPGTEDDPRNRAKTAQLQLEDFQKNRYNNDLKEKLGWTQEKYDAFLRDQAKRAEQLQKEAVAYEEELRNNPKGPTGPPTLNADGGGKLESTTKGPGAAGSGAVFTPPGFEDAKRKFEEELRKRNQKK